MVSGEGPIPNTLLIFHLDMFTVRLQQFRCLPRSLTQFALSRFFSGAGGVVTFRSVTIIPSRYRKTSYFVNNGRKTRWRVFLLAMVHSFWDMDSLSCKIVDFAKKNVLSSPKLGRILANNRKVPH